MDDWWEYAKELAKAERELQIGHWVRISIEYRDEAGDTVRLHSYDLPRELHERYRWVVRWREARLQCLHPRRHIHTYYSYYDKRTGLRTDFNPACQDCQRQRHRLPSRKGKRRSIWNTSVQTTCSSMKPPTGSCNSSGRNYASRKKIIRHWKPKSVLR